MWALVISLLTKALGFIPQLLTGINFSSVFSMIGGLFTNIQQHWKVWLIALLTTLQVSTAYEWYHTSQLLKEEKASHASDISNFKQAQAAATAKATQEAVTLKKESQANADVADAKYSTLLAQYRASLLRYAQSNSSSTGQSGNNQLPPAQSPDGSSPSPDISGITITLGDAQICAVNTARLQAAHDWALNPPKDTSQ